MARKLTKTEKKNWHRYKTPGCSNLCRRKINAVFLSTANSERHEMAKCKKAFELMKLGHKILTEAEEIKTKLRRDLVDLTTGEVYEFETDKRRAKRHKPGINVIITESLL